MVLLTNWARNVKVAGGRTLLGFWLPKFMNLSLKDDLSSNGRLLMMLRMRVWVSNAVEVLHVVELLHDFQVGW